MNYENLHRVMEHADELASGTFQATLDDGDPINLFCDTCIICLSDGDPGTSFPKADKAAKWWRGVLAKDTGVPLTLAGKLGHFGCYMRDYRAPNFKVIANEYYARLFSEDAEWRATGPEKFLTVYEQDKLVAICMPMRAHSLEEMPAVTVHLPDDVIYHRCPEEDF